jgi:MFS family permease
VGALDALVVTTALSTIRLDLGASIEELEWTVNAYNPELRRVVADGLGDRFGRRRMFAYGIGLTQDLERHCDEPARLLTRNTWRRNQ